MFMRRLPTAIVAFVIGLAIFYNIERLDFGQQNIVNIDSVVYVIGLVAVVSVVWIPILRRSNVFVSGAAWLGIYISAKVLLFVFLDRRPLLGGIYTYLSITEVVLLLVTVWLAHAVASALDDFEGAVEKVTFTDNNKRIRRLDEATDEIQHEIFRSRHYHHPLSVVIVKPEPGFIQTELHRAVQEVQQAMLKTYVINSMAQTFSKYVRRTDLILEQRDQERFMILCPDTNAADLTLLVEYLQVVAQDQFGASVVCGTATFPDEAITFEELMRQAESRLNHRDSNNQETDRNLSPLLTEDGQIV
jgi:hypothetical protein